MEKQVMSSKPFEKILVANRGEIARRIIRTAKRLGIWTIAVHSDIDAEAPFALEADEKHLLGAAAPKESYLNIEKILQIAKDSGAEAIHPGYGFLSENPQFVRSVKAAGLKFIGPGPEPMERMGSKLDARKIAEAAGVPIIPGSGPVTTLEEAQAAAEAIGYPVLMKASAGGGGIGMTAVKNEKKLERALADVQRKGETFFGDGTVYLEKLIEKPAHVEIQVLSDEHGNCVILGDRDCSVQRRNQKIIEETPSTHIDEATRQKMFEAARALVKDSGYVNAGTVEMIVEGGGDSVGNFYFLEVNARLQVEHPVTEFVTGFDLVEAQFRVAAGEALSPELLSPRFEGHSIEARICAEDPDKRFFPQPGTITNIEWPKNARVDAGVESGSVVPPTYDSLLAKIIVHGANRSQAITRLSEAISETKIEGIKTNLSAVQKVLESELFLSGEHDTSIIKELGYKY